MTEIRPDSVVLATECYLGDWSLRHQTAKSVTDPKATFFFADDEDIAPLVAHQVRAGQGKKTPGKRFRLFLVEADDDDAAVVEALEKGRYGQYARALKQSGFLRCPEVWRVMGSDAEFRAWTTRQPSIVSGEFNEIDDAGDRRNVACHVRRAGEAGTAYKPAYACVPMTDAEHQEQHQHGEAAVYARYLRHKRGCPGLPAPELVDEAAAWFDQQRIRIVERWAWDCLKRALGFESMADVPPDALVTWAQAEQVERLLPRMIREAQ